MPNPITNGNLKYIVTMTISIVVAVGMAVTFIVGYESSAEKTACIEKVVETKLAPIEVELRYMRSDIREIKEIVKDLQTNHD